MPPTKFGSIGRRPPQRVHAFGPLSPRGPRGQWLGRDRHEMKHARCQRNTGLLPIVWRQRLGGAGFGAACIDVTVAPLGDSRGGLFRWAFQTSLFHQPPRPRTRTTSSPVLSANAPAGGELTASLLIDPTTKGTIMRSTTPTKVLTQTSQCLAAAGLLVGIAFAASPNATARPVEDRLNDCYNAGNSWKACCEWLNGTWEKKGQPPEEYCHVKDYGLSLPPPGSAPTKPAIPGQTGGEQGPGAPITPVPVAPNTGRG